MKVGQRLQLAAIELKAGHFKAAKDILFGSHAGREVRKNSGGYHVRGKIAGLIGKINKKLRGRHIKKTSQPVEKQFRQVASNLAKDALEKHQSLGTSNTPKPISPVLQHSEGVVRKQLSSGFNDNPSLIKQELKSLAPRNSLTVETYSLKIQKAIAELKAENPELEQAAQDWMFMLFKTLSVGKRDLPLLAKLREIDEAGHSNPHLNSLRMFLNMAIAIDLVREGPQPVDHHDVARMDKSHRLDERKQATALRARTAWMAQAGSKELRRLTLRPAKLNQIIGSPYDMRQELASLVQAIDKLPESVAENKTLKTVSKKISALMGDEIKRKDDFAVSAAVLASKKELIKLATSASADTAAVNFARVWDNWPEEYVRPDKI